MSDQKRSSQKMVAFNIQEGYSKIFLRYGQVPLGQNPDTKSSLEEVSLSGSEISSSLSKILILEDAFSLRKSYGDSVTGDPATFDFLRLTQNSGKKKEIEVFNMAIMMVMDNTEETRRVFRIINAIKDEQAGGDQPSTR